MDCFLAGLLSLHLAAAQTIFTIQMRPVPGAPSPMEFFEDFQMQMQDPNSPLFTDPAFATLSKVDPNQDFGENMDQLFECNLEPFWEKEKIVSDLSLCPLSQVKLIVYALVPATTMFFGLLGLWSRQRNVQGRGKETQVGSLICLGLAMLSTGYDWFFCWTVFRDPRTELQHSLSDLGMAHLIGCIALYFLTVHFWFRRKFLVGMPWYEYHKHGVSLHFIFTIMYVQPQTIMLFQSRLFNIDVFNIHFGTPSKMSEVLSNVGCLSLAHDIPQIVLQSWIGMEEFGNKAPQVYRVSIALSLLSVAFQLKRQYIASAERQWYKEIVRMAGVRRLTTYGGASRWLQFQKRPSAAADIKASASTSQQQLFLAWMQSMGRRQESIFAGQDAADALGPGIPEDGSEDSEDDLDTLSDNEGSEEAGSEEPSGSDKGSESVEEAEASYDEDDEEEPRSSEASEDASDVDEQAYRSRSRRVRSRASREEAPLGRPGGLLGFARGVAEDMTASGASASAISESDIFALARDVAGRVSESGVTESHREAAFRDADVFSAAGESSAMSDDAMLNFARGIAQEAPSDIGASAGGSDVLAFARQIAQAASESGVTGSDSDIFAFARRMAGAASESGAGASNLDIFEFARDVAQGVESSVIRSDAESDVLAIARRAAEGGSQTSGSQSGTDIFALARQVAEDASRSGVGATSVGSASDIMALATRAADTTSQSGAGASSVAQTESDIFAFARNIATGVSQSGVGSASGVRLSDDPGYEASGVHSDIFALARQAALDASRSGVGQSSDAQSGKSARSARSARSGHTSSESTDLFAAAQQAAQMSASGVGTDSRNRPQGTGLVLPEAPQRAEASEMPSESEEDLDIFALARGVADATSRSGVGSGFASRITAGGLEDLFMPAQRTLSEADGSKSGADSGSDIFAAAHRAVEERSAVSSGQGSDIFAAIQRVADEQSALSSEPGSGASDIFAFAQHAAEEVSKSGVGSDAELGIQRRRFAAEQLHSRAPDVPESWFGKHPAPPRLAYTPAPPPEAPAFDTVPKPHGVPCAFDDQSPVNTRYDGWKSEDPGGEYSRQQMEPDGDSIAASQGELLSFARQVAAAVLPSSQVAGANLDHRAKIALDDDIFLRGSASTSQAMAARGHGQAFDTDTQPEGRVEHYDMAAKDSPPHSPRPSLAEARHQRLQQRRAIREGAVFDRDYKRKASRTSTSQ